MLYVDTRYRWKPGQRVYIGRGPHAGHWATVDRMAAQIRGEDGALVTVPGYNVELDDGRRAQVRWSWAFVAPS